MRYDIEEYKMRENCGVECTRCKKVKCLTELFERKDNVINTEYICCDCLKIYDELNQLKYNTRMCTRCECYRESWKFVEKTMVGSYIITDKCLNCRLYLSYEYNMLEREKITCSYCEKQYTYLEIFKVNRKCICTVCIEENMGKDIPNVISPLKYDVNGKYCSKGCEKFYPEFYFINDLCYKCAYRKILREKVNEKRKECDIYKVDDVENSDFNLQIGQYKSVRERYLEIFDEHTTISLSPPKYEHFFRHKQLCEANTFRGIEDDEDEFEEDKIKCTFYSEFDHLQLLIDTEELYKKKLHEKIEKFEFLKQFPSSYSNRSTDDIDKYKEYKSYETVCTSCRTSVTILKICVYEDNCYCLKCASNMMKNKYVIFSSWIKESKDGKKCVKCNKIYPSFLYIDDDYYETRECLVCRNNENLLYLYSSEYLLDEGEDSKINLERLFSQYKANSMEVKCKSCNIVIEKTNAYGSAREGKTVEYERNNEYICFECAVKMKIENKVILFKRVFYDECIGVKACKKCEKVYPCWHYIYYDGKKLSLTKNCLECRNLEKLTKSVKSKKTIFPHLL